MKRRGSGQRLSRLLRHPAASGLCLFLLVLNVHGLFDPGRPLPIFPRWLQRVAGLPAAPPQVYSDAVYLLRVDDGILVLDPETQSVGRLARAVREEPDDVMEAILTFDVTARGLWAITGLTRRATIRLEPMGDAFSASEQLEGRRVAFEWMRSGFGWPESLEDDPFTSLATADQVAHEIDVEGYLHNLSAVIVLVALVYSLGWIRDVPEWWRRRARRAGRCPRCGYDLRGLRHGPCPECGDDARAQ